MCSSSATAPRSSGGPDKEPGGGLLADRSLVAVQPYGELARSRLGRAHLELLAGHEPLVVEPVQEVAVVLGEPDDGGPPAGRDVAERREVAVLLLLERRVDRPAVRAALGVAELLGDPLDHVVAEGVAELVGVSVRLGAGVAEEVRQPALDQPMLAHDALGALTPGGGEERLLAFAPLDQAVGLEPL